MVAPLFEPAHLFLHEPAQNVRGYHRTSRDTEKRRMYCIELFVVDIRSRIVSLSDDNKTMRFTGTLSCFCMFLSSGTADKDIPF